MCEYRARARARWAAAASSADTERAVTLAGERSAEKKRGIYSVEFCNATWRESTLNTVPLGQYKHGIIISVNRINK